jgi:hypothetical protein
MSSVAGECGWLGWLVQALLIEVEVFPGALPLPYCSLVLFPAALTPIRPAAAGPFDQCDQVEEERWARPI